MNNSSLPTGTVTFLFTDMENSTKLAHEYADEWESMRARHHDILHDAIESNHGYVFQIIGDSFSTAFHTAGDALKAAIKAQVYLKNEVWIKSPIKIRMGIHTGAAHVGNIEDRSGGYIGYITLSFVQRVMSIGHGGQILISNASYELIRNELPDKVTLQNMGNHHLKGLPNPEQIWQVNVPGLQHEFPPPSSSKVLSNNLPVQLTSFVGREKEIGKVKDVLARHPLVTLIGPGGTGKTRLSLHVAQEMLDQYSDGVWFVEFAPILDPILVPRTTAITIGLRDEPQRPIIDILCDYLHKKQLLIVLDNCEHLVDACAQMAHKILQAAPNVRILASSREVFGITGETTYRVPSLELPELDFMAVESLMEHEATRLFVDRATSAVSTFSVTDDNASAIIQICRRLDGIPLAIELAAAKTRVLSVDQIAKRLDDRFHLLIGGSRTAMERHQTLQATIDWSYNLLSPAEQILFSRFSVFVGGWTLEAAESVCSDKNTTTKTPLKAYDILELLSQLINKSLVATDERNGEIRYQMLETIRQYANEELLKFGDTEKVQTQHLDYFTRISEEAEPKLLGRDQLIWIEHLEHELDNIRAALEWSSKSGHVIAGLRLAGALWRFWDVRNHWSEGRERLTALISRPEAKVRIRERAKALYTAGLLAQIQNDHASAGPLYFEGLAISRELGDNQTIGYFLVGLARTWRRFRRDQDAGSLLDESLEIFQQLNDKWGIALLLEVRGNVALEQDDFAVAGSCRAESVKIYRELEDKISLSFALTGLAFVMVCQGNYDQSVSLYEESLTLFREMGHKWGIAHSLNALGEVARCQGNYDRAKFFYEQSLSTSQEIGDKARIGASLHNLGYVSQHHGDYHQAVKLFNEGLIMAREVRDTLAVAVCLVGLAGQVQAMGYPKRAAQLFGAAQSLFESSSNRFPPADQIEYQRNLAATRTKLDEATFKAAFAKGQMMTIDESLNLALKPVEEM